MLLLSESVWSYPRTARVRARGRILLRLPARVDLTFRAMAAAQTFGRPSTLRTCEAAARATALRVIGLPAAALRFSCFTVRRTMEGTARTAGRVARRRRRMR
jgi:hypothetical protein